MQNSIVKKSLVIGIIFLFIVIGIQPILANKLINTSNENDISTINGLLDIIISRVQIQKKMTDWGEIYYKYGCYVKNIGDSSAHNYQISVDVDVYKAKIFQPDKFKGSYYGARGLGQLDPNQEIFITFLETYERAFPEYFLRFECHCDGNFAEENTDNNYYKKTYFYYHFGELFLGLISLLILF